MTKQDTKSWIRELTEDYLRETRPDQLQDLEKTWQVFEELKLLDQGGIQLRDSDTLPMVGASGDVIVTITSAIVLGIVSNAVYDTLKWSARRVIKTIDDNKWQEKFIDRMGKLQGRTRDEAQATLRWTLAEIHRHKKSP